MKITNEWLVEKRACHDGKKWFSAQKETNGIKVVEKLINEKHLDWANWLIVRIMNRDQYLRYAIFSAEQVLDIYEKRYPTDSRPRLAIEAVKKCVNNDTEESKDAAHAASSAAYAAASSATYAAASSATYAAAYAAASSATYAAASAAAYAAASAAASAVAYAVAYAVAHAASAVAHAVAGDNMRTKILQHGLSLLSKKDTRKGE